MSDSFVEKRPRRWRKTKLTLVVLAVVVVVGACWWQAGLSRARMDWEETRQSVVEAGHPVSFEELEALRAEVPDEQNAALLIEELADRFEELQPSENVMLFDTKGRTMSDSWLFAGIDPETLEASGAYLTKHEALVSDLAELKNRPTGRKNISYLPWANDPIGAILPSLAAYRQAAKLLSLQAILRAAEGDMARACECNCLLFHVAGALDNDVTIIDHIVQVSINQLGVDLLEGILLVGELDEEQLEAMSDVLDMRFRKTSPLNGLRYELVTQLTLCERIIDGTVSFPSEYNADDSESGWLGDLRNWQPEETLRGSQIIMAERMLPILNAVKDEDWQAFRDLTQSAYHFNRLNSGPWDKYRLPNSLTFSFERGCELSLLCRAELLSARVAMAVEEYRLKIGGFPESLDVLVPDFLEVVPADPFGGKPLRYAKTDEGVVIYSVGSNDVDDGGSVAPYWDEKEGRYIQSLDAGFRLLDQDKRGFRVLENVQQDDGQE